MRPKGLPPVVQHRFSFESAAKASTFVLRLRLELPELATLHAPDSVDVHIIDPYEPPKTERILQLARCSSATWAKWKGPE